jgi:hypothetical protein
MKRRKGINICCHNIVKKNCVRCKGSSICIHLKRRTICVKCKGGSICSHLRRRSQCKECKELKKHNEKYYNNCSTSETFNNIKLCIHNNKENDCNACKNEYNLVKSFLV